MMGGHLWNEKHTAVYGMFVLASLVYIGGLSPTIHWRDAAEFVTVVHSFGISHPAGSPTYTLLAKLATFVPFGNIALRVNLFSALLGALTIALLCALLYDLSPASPPWARRYAVLSGGLFLLFSESFWRFSEVAEVYTLQNGLLVLCLTLLLKARGTHTPSPACPSRNYWLFAFLYGLSAGVHATMALFAPAFLIFIGLSAPRQLRPKSMAFLAFFFLLGLAVFLYLPLRSLRDPVYDWGDPQRWQQFVMHLLDRKDAAAISAFSWVKLPHQINIYLANLANEFSLLGLALALVGCVYLFYRDTSLALLLSLIFLGNVGFFIRFWTMAFGFIPSFVITALWIGCGTGACLRGMVNLYQHHHPRIPQPLVQTCLVGGIIVSLISLSVRHAAVAYQSRNHSAENYGKILLRQLPFDAILFSQEAWFTLLYLQHVERRRPDLTVLLQGEVFAPQYFAPLSTARFPNLRLTAVEEPMMMSPREYFWYLARINQPQHALFWDPDSDFQKRLEEHLLPQGLLFTFHPSQHLQLSPQVIQRHKQLLSRSVPVILQNDRDHEASKLVAKKLQLMGLYFKRRQWLAEAADMYQMGLHLQSDNVRLRAHYGRLLLSQGKPEQALSQLEIAYRDNPIDPSVNWHLGMSMLETGNAVRAVEFFERLRSFGAAGGDLYLILGESYIRLGRFAEATEALRAALQAFAQPQVWTASEVQLSQKKQWVSEKLHLLEQGSPLPPPALRAPLSRGEWVGRPEE